MDIEDVPDSVRERLGIDATGGLLQLLDNAHAAWRADVIAACTERFERRLVEQVAEVRVQLAQGEASLRQEIAESRAEMRQDIARSSAVLRQEIATGRVELFKWCFIFWVGQVVTLTGILGLMLRVFRV